MIKEKDGEEEDEPNYPVENIQYLVQEKPEIIMDIFEDIDKKD